MKYMSTVAAKMNNILHSCMVQRYLNLTELHLIWSELRSQQYTNRATVIRHVLASGDHFHLSQFKIILRDKGVKCEIKIQDKVYIKIKTNTTLNNTKLLII